MTPRVSFGPRFLKSISKARAGVSEKSAGPMPSWLGNAHLAWETVRWFHGQRIRSCDSEPYSVVDIHLLQFCLSFPDSSTDLLASYSLLGFTSLNEPMRVSTHF